MEKEENIRGRKIYFLRRSWKTDKENIFLWRKSRNEKVKGSKHLENENVNIARRISFQTQPGKEEILGLRGAPR